MRPESILKRGIAMCQSCLECVYWQEVCQNVMEPRESEIWQYEHKISVQGASTLLSLQQLNVHLVYHCNVTWGLVCKCKVAASWT